jgi:hypothetical protein
VLEFDQGETLNKKIIYTIVIAVAVIVAATLGYRQYSAYKFNQVVSDLNTKKVKGTENYIKMSDLLNSLSAYLSSADNSLNASTLQSSELSSKVTQTKNLVNSACNQKSKGITGDKLNRDTKYLWLSANQKRYINDSIKTFGSYEKTEFSNAGICSDGKLAVALYGNLADLYPGLIVLGQLNSQSTSPNTQQLNSLKQYTTRTSLKDEGLLQQNMPSSVQFINTTNELLADVYYALNAQQNGQTDLATKYSSDIDNLIKKDETDFKKADKEISNFEIKANTNGVALANQEKAVINYQKSQHSNFADKLDYSIPVFWLIDSKVGLYGANHNDVFPAASNLGGLLAALKDSDLNELKSRGLLKDATYTVLGKDRSGYSITVKLSNGKILVDKSLPN